MKKLFLLFLLFLLPFTFHVYGQKVATVKENKFTGIYNGLNEYSEFEFIADNGKILVFQDIGDNITVDLYDELNYSKKFEVTWVKEKEEVLDEEGEPTGEVEEVNMILSLKELE
jgi:hypothetical protein